MATIKAIKNGRVEMIPITKDIGIEQVKAKFNMSFIPEVEKEWCKAHVAEYDVIFLVCDLDNDIVVGKVICKPDAEDSDMAEILYEKIDSLSMKEFCDVIYSASHWIFKHAIKKKVLLACDNLKEDRIKRLKLVEFKKSKRDGYIERNASSEDVLPTVLSVLSGL